MNAPSPELVGLLAEEHVRQLRRDAAEANLVRARARGAPPVRVVVGHRLVRLGERLSREPAPRLN